MAQLIEARTELPVERKLGLGGTMICFSALQSGAVDIYPEYTGTAWSAILNEKDKVTDPLRAFLHVQHRFREDYGIEWLQPFGFNNGYALVMSKTKAQELGVRTISDLIPHMKSLKFGATHEFLERSDSYPGLQKTYGLDFGEARGMEHGLAYAAIRTGAIDLVDAYTTDGKLLKMPLVLLEDDRNFFPPYDAAPLIRSETLKRHPELRNVIAELAYRLPEASMQRLNLQAEEGMDFAEVARRFLTEEGLVEGEPMGSAEPSERRTFVGLMKARANETLRLAGEHILLTAIAVLLAALFAVPLGIVITRRERLSQLALGTAGVIQTIPSLALLAFMIPIPFLGLGVNAAIAALFLYAILPILRNTYTGISEVDANLIEAARGIGLTERQVLIHVQLPLASRTIMAGIRTSTVISVGVATLAAFVGAGGLGEPILTGLQLNDTNMILTGAVPAALLALVVDFTLGRIEDFVSPRGL